MEDENRKYQCLNCKRIFKKHLLKQAQNPFDTKDILRACPDCLAIERFDAICDHAQCINPVQVGIHSKAGYTQLCGYHASMRNE